MDKVSVTPKPNRRKGSRISQIKGKSKSNKMAMGQQSTKRMAQSTSPVNSLIAEG
ncbi:MAG: hypothetical protein WD431_15620 [Cyclobacteriaceae bacterium]